MDAVKSVSCIGWPDAPCTDSGEHDGVTNYRPKEVGVRTGRHVYEGVGVVRKEATPFSTSHKTLETIQVTLVQEPLSCWRRVGPT